jgi:sensor histidine kinase YesM
MRTPSRSTAYWTCQILGWGGYAIAGVVSAAPHTGWHLSIMLGYLLYALYSIALTHLLRREIKRKQWLAGPAGMMWMRLLLAACVICAMQTFLIVAINLALEGRQSAFVTNPETIGFVGLGTTAATVMWVVYYVLFTARLRRREELAQVQLALRDAELHALEAQVNPHFLFNCLNSIRGLVVENPPQAQEMITRLAHILRHNLSRDAAHTVPLSSEVDVVTDYLALESVRFDDRLRARFDLAPGTGEIPVPSMLLQTLVENAVKYGIAPLPAGGDLVIRATVDRGLLVITVDNTGQLADAHADATQVGLANTRERLRLLYGDRARLEVTNVDRHRVAATVRIPV